VRLRVSTHTQTQRTGEDSDLSKVIMRRLLAHDCEVEDSEALRAPAIR